MICALLLVLHAQQVISARSRSCLLAHCAALRQEREASTMLTELGSVPAIPELAAAARPSRNLPRGKVTRLLSLVQGSYIFTDMRKLWCSTMGKHQTKPSKRPGSVSPSAALMELSSQHHDQATAHPQPKQWAMLNLCQGCCAHCEAGPGRVSGAACDPGELGWVSR
jgi:hypothetical protein